MQLGIQGSCHFIGVSVTKLLTAAGPGIRKFDAKPRIALEKGTPWDQKLFDVAEDLQFAHLDRIEPGVKAWHAALIAAAEGQVGWTHFSAPNTAQANP